ncbi:hypothetical protein SLA2020_463780 [Shorea laevis]
MGILSHSSVSRLRIEIMRLIVGTFVGVVLGFLIGVSFPTLSMTKLDNGTNAYFWRLNIKSALLPVINFAYEDKQTGLSTQTALNDLSVKNSDSAHNASDTSKIWVPSNPRGAERLPPGIVRAESDLYLRRLWGNPKQDLTIEPKYLVTFTVGYDQRKNIDAAVKKFSENFTVVLFHYDGRTTEWEEFEWSKKAIHISTRRQTKWWYAKRFLHPDIVARYDYIFIWDEDLGVEHFNAEEYIKLVRKHGLEISQPALVNEGINWPMTKRISDREVHKEAEEGPSWCADSHIPPCAEFVEIMAPVFSRDAWRCVWHMIQNDLVHGWGLDFALRKCVEPAHEKIGVVDAQWIVHQYIPTLKNQGESEKGKAQVGLRCKKEWKMFQDRFASAENAYYQSMRINPSNSS